MLVAITHVDDAPIWSAFYTVINTVAREFTREQRSKERDLLGNPAPVTVTRSRPIGAEALKGQMLMMRAPNILYGRASPAQPPFRYVVSSKF